MSKSVVVVDRLRRQLKKSARMEYAARERERQVAEQVLASTEASLRTTRSEPEQDVIYLTERFAFLDQLEAARRTQERSLHERTGAVENQRQVLQKASQEARATELVLERTHQEEMAETRRQETRTLDALAIARWRPR